MDKNVGGLDRTARLVLGSLLVIAVAASFGGYFELGSTVGLVGVLAGAILLVTGATERCPITLAAGSNTDRKEVDPGPPAPIRRVYPAQSRSTGHA